MTSHTNPTVSARPRPQLRALRAQPTVDEVISGDRLRLYAQRIVPLHKIDSGNSHFECLLRLIDHTGAATTPSGLIGAAEYAGTISVLDRWVVEQALQQIAEHRQRLGPRVTCTINVSPASLSNPTFAEHVAAALDRYMVPNVRICFEITETAPFTDLDVALHFMTTMKNRGCLFALDDFGTGTASFSNLKRLPLDILKIDSVFVRNLLKDAVDASLVAALGEVGKAMGLTTVAEGVHDNRVLSKLRTFEIDYAQGFILGMPKPLEMWRPGAFNTCSAA